MVSLFLVALSLLLSIVFPSSVNRLFAGLTQGPSSVRASAGGGVGTFEAYQSSGVPIYTPPQGGTVTGGSYTFGQSIPEVSIGISSGSYAGIFTIPFAMQFEGSGTYAIKATTDSVAQAGDPDFATATTTLIHEGGNYGSVTAGAPDGNFSGDLEESGPIIIYVDYDSSEVAHFSIKVNVYIEINNE